MASIRRRAMTCLRVTIFSAMVVPSVVDDFGEPGDAPGFLAERNLDGLFEDLMPFVLSGREDVAEQVDRPELERVALEDCRECDLGLLIQFPLDDLEDLGEAKVGQIGRAHV